MTKMGRPRKPAALQKLLGNPSRRRPRVEPQPLRRSRPRAPTWLSSYAKQEWRRVVDELWRIGIVVRLDEMALAAHCESVAVMRASAEVLQQIAAGDAGRGLIAKMGSGSVVQNPILGIFNVARRDVLRSCAELGLSPTGRAGLDAALPADDPIIAKYFRGDWNE